MDKDKQIKQEATIMAKMNPNMANREVMNLVLLDYKTKVPFMKIDFANVSTTNFQANRVYAKAYHGYYRSQMRPQALVASMTTWMARYDTPIVMCNAETSGQLIYDILYREMKEAMINL